MTSVGRPPEFVSVGEPLVAFVATSSGPLVEVANYSTHVVGAEVNVAVGVSRLGHRASLVGRVGNDPFGTVILRRLMAEGVRVDHLIRDPAAPTALLFRNLRRFPPPEVIYRRAGCAGARLTPDDVVAAFDGLPPGTIVHLSGVTPALSESCRTATRTVMEVVRTLGLDFFVDVNYRRRLWPVEEARPVLLDLVSSASIVTASLDEAALLTGAVQAPDAVTALLDLGPHTVVVRDGPLLAVAGTKTDRAPVVARNPIPVEPLDPVGAGDAFNAGLAAGLLRHGDLLSSLMLAHQCGAAVVGVVGDIEGMPTYADLESAGGDVSR
ncbi:MAG TPA: sugar kinase [Acidimicrobiales bacterium]|nr:sugar kinase [Acidimicrobiales bacterium]